MERWQYGAINVVSCFKITERVYSAIRKITLDFLLNAKFRSRLPVSPAWFV